MKSEGLTVVRDSLVQVLHPALLLEASQNDISKVTEVTERDGANVT
jgi:hypothetical protein